MPNLHAWKAGFDRVHEDLLQIFGPRLRSLVAYQSHFGVETAGPGTGPGGEDEHAHAMVLVETLAYADLVACAGRTADWLRLGVGTPLFLTREEFERSLDAFPLEFSAIAAHHLLVAGSDPFAAVTIDRDDVRRACETQAKSHLLHLREGFLEVRGEPAGVARLIAASVPSFRTLLLNLARLESAPARSREALAEHGSALLGVPKALLDQVRASRRPEDVDRTDTLRIYTAYLDAVERLARLVDGWRQ